MLGYHFNKKVGVWAGYTHDPNYVGGHFLVMEQRAREQVTLDNIADLGPGRVSARFRFEERWRDRTSGTGWRFRPFIRYTLPFTNGSKTAFTITEEPFIDLNTTSFQKVRGLERARTFVGIVTPVAKNLSAEVGYLNQHGFVPNGPDTNDHVASISVSLSL
jgi:hypothetical protein